MTYQFQGFRATKPVVKFKEEKKGTLEVFFIVYEARGKKHPIRISDGINSQPVNQRKIEALATASILWDSLQKGWNPLTTKLPIWLNSLDHHTPLLFSEALDLAIEIKQKSLSKYSMYDYKGCVRFMKAAAKTTGILNTDIRQVKRKDMRLLIATAKELNNWSSNSRNKHLSILQSLLSVLVDEERLEYNPAHKIKSEPVNEGMGFRPATDEEKELIAKKLLSVAPDFFDYIMFIYQSGIRRKELCMIQIKDINLQRRELTIRSEVAKTNRMRIVPLSSDVYEILMNRDVYKLPKEWYLFSTDNFKPGEKMFHPNTPTNWWNKLIISEKTGIGVDVKLYGLKHTGADDRIRAGMDLDVLKTLYGHRSKMMTENYAKAVRENYASQIRNNSPAFAKVVQLRKAK